MGPDQHRADQRTRPHARAVIREPDHALELRSEAATGDQQLPTPRRPVYLFSLVQTTTLFSQAGGASSLWPLASSLVGLIVRFPGCPPLDMPTVGGATPTLLGGVPSGGVCDSAHLLTSGRVLNGDRVESETGRVRRPLLADWLRKDAMPTFDSAHARTCWRAREECREQSVVAVRAKMVWM